MHVMLYGLDIRVGDLLEYSCHGLRSCPQIDHRCMVNYHSFATRGIHFGLTLSSMEDVKTTTSITCSDSWGKRIASTLCSFWNCVSRVLSRDQSIHVVGRID